MTLTSFDITRQEAYGDGSYERVDGVAHYRVDPAAPCNAVVVDLGAAPCDEHGHVRFSGDVTILRPVERRAANGMVLLDVPNRGRRVIPGMLNRAPVDLEPTDEIHPGDGFLLRRGWTMAWGAWQWDVPAGPGRMTFNPPTAVGADGRSLEGWMQLRLQLTRRVTTVALTDQHVGPLGLHEPIPAVDDDATLTVRDGLFGETVAVPRAAWRFVEGRTHLHLDDGFEPGRIYDLVYRVATCPVVGTGMLALRDLAAHLRTDQQQVIATGMSQNSRLLRTMLHLGLDRAEDGSRAFDGALMLVGGARRGEFNHRFAQPSVQPTPSFGHLFPFADEAQADPRTGRTAGLLDAVAGRPDPPKLMFVDTAAEYWRGDASLAHTSVVDGDDVADAPFVRRYLLAGAQHGPGYLPLSHVSAQGSVGANHLNIVDYTPLYRAALVNLEGWVRDGVEPPESAVPRHRDGTATSREAVIARLADLPMALPDPAALPRIFPLDLGVDADAGIGAYPARPHGEPYPCIVSAVDADGNEIAGIAMPDVTVPVATHTGWNPRHPDIGGPGQLLEYSGSTVPFAPDRAARERVGDPRPSIDERYRDRDDYATQLRNAAEALVARRHLLEEDVELCVRVGLARYDACRGTTGHASTT